MAFDRRRVLFDGINFLLLQNSGSSKSVEFAGVSRTIARRPREERLYFDSMPAQISYVLRPRRADFSSQSATRFSEISRVGHAYSSSAMFNMPSNAFCSTSFLVKNKPEAAIAMVAHTNKYGHLRLCNPIPQIRSTVSRAIFLKSSQRLAGHVRVSAALGQIEREASWPSQGG
ncbi:hypothetical protein BJX65DRAFT_283579 [Aspergillus insuetus]